MIVDLSLFEPAVLSSSPFRQRNAQNYHFPPNVLSMVSKEARKEVRFMHNAVIQSTSAPQFKCHVDIDSDILKVYRMRLPQLTSAVPGGLRAEIHKLLNVEFCLQWMDEDEALQVASSQGVSIGSLELGQFPKLQEFTSVCLYSAHWQRHGCANMVCDGTLEDGVLCFKDDSAPKTGMQWNSDAVDEGIRDLHFIDKGLTSRLFRRRDTWLTGISIETIADMLMPTFHGGLGISELAVQISDVALFGYTWTESSYGGEWAGFRYHTVDGKVEFSTLTWSDVKAESLSCQYDRARFVDNEPISEAGYQLPMAVVKVFIVRPGQELPLQDSRHTWVEVPDYSSATFTWQTMQRELWNGIAGQFNTRSWTGDYFLSMIK